MGGAASVSDNKELLREESLQALHGLNLSIAQGSLPALKSLPSLSDDDMHCLVQAFHRKDAINQESLINQIDVIQEYLSRLKSTLTKAPCPVAAALAIVEEAKKENKNDESIVLTADIKPINLCDEGKMYPFSVSLEFLLHFLKEHPEAENMTTGEVVDKIIIPETKESQLTYVEEHLVDKHPQYLCVMTPKGYGFDNQVSFLSHAWLMPFRTVIDIAVSSMRALFTRFGYIPPLEDYAHKSFFWMDIFCKNQHIPTPAMDEFETAMRLSNQVVLALYPVTQVNINYVGDLADYNAQVRKTIEDAENGKTPQPIVLSRIWCLFEIMTCLNMKKSLVPAVADDHLATIRPELFMVDVCKAQATVPADVDMILGLVKASVGIEEMNRLVKKAVLDSLSYQIASLDPSCFDGDGWVYVPSTSPSFGNNEIIKLQNISKCLVKDLKRGNKVLTCVDPAASAKASSITSLMTQYPSLFAWATVSLITKDELSTLNQNPLLTDEDPMSLWDVQGLAITSEHPVWDSQQDKWVKARECKGAKRSNKTLNYVYNIELERGCEGNGGVQYGNVLVNEVMVMTLGHGYDFDVETDKFYGFGWYNNPKRVREMLVHD